jgi:DNA polymerase-3 subunit alpha
MNGKTDEMRDAKKLQQILAPYRASGSGTCKVVVRYENGKAACEVTLGDAWRVRPDERLLSELSAWLAPESVQVTYA